jgi:dual oxidase
MQQEELKNNAGGKTSVDKMAVREWLHANHRRLVKVKFGPEAAIHTVDRKGEKLRTVNFRTSEALTVEESQVTTLNFTQQHAVCGLYWHVLIPM